MGSRCALLRPGLVDYEAALDLQRRTAEGVRAGGDEALILLEHPPTYTLGVRGRTEHILASATMLADRGARVIRSDRGGDVTFHGPGQIVGYPIINLRARKQGAVWYVRTLEQVIIDALAAFGIDGRCQPGQPGVWTDAGKIAAIGVRVSGGVTTHGFALNVSTDLSYFDLIIPCGLSGTTVTSLAALGMAADIDAVCDGIVAAFGRHFGVELGADAGQEVAVGR